MEECISDCENTCGDYQPGIHQKAVPVVEAQPDFEGANNGDRKVCQGYNEPVLDEIVSDERNQDEDHDQRAAIAVLIRKSGMSGEVLCDLVVPSIIFALNP